LYDQFNRIRLIAIDIAIWLASTTGSPRWRYGRPQ